MKIAHFFAISLSITLTTVSAQRIAYIHGDVAPDGSVPSGDVSPFHQMLLTDAGRLGTSEFRGIVEDHGYSIEQFYDQETELTSAFLASFDALIFGLHQKIWSDAERRALDAWLRQGGAMLIYSDSASGGHFGRVGLKNPVGQQVTNNLIAPYGMEVTVDLGGGTRSYRAPESDNPILAGRPVFEGEGVSPVAVDRQSDAQVLIPLSPANREGGSDLNIDQRNLTIEDPQWAAMAHAPVGDGHILVIFDRQPMWNDGPGSHIDRADNREIMSRLVQFLVGDL